MPKGSSSEIGTDSLTFGQGMRRVPIDAKGRITIPGRYRSIYVDDLRGLEHAIHLRTLNLNSNQWNVGNVKDLALGQF